MIPEEERFLTRAVLEASSMIGRREQLLLRLRELAGTLTHVVVIADENVCNFAQAVVQSLVALQVRTDLVVVPPGEKSKSVESAMRTTAMIMLIILAANVLNFVLASVGLSKELSDFLDGVGFGPTGTILLIMALYFVLGFFVETLSLMVITIPIVTPIVFGMGFDPVWFGIMVILLIEMALITPPVGLNLYVVQGVRKSGSLNDIMLGAIPFVLVMMLMAILILIFPSIALWLPGVLG